MTTPPPLLRNRSIHTVRSRFPRRARAAFTLVELLVVITIIVILAGLLTGAAIVARKWAKNAAISTELKTGLEAACMEYKNKFGEFPPDFSGVTAVTTRTDIMTGGTITYEAQNLVLRHLAAAFPRYQPGVSTIGGAKTALTAWAGFRADVLGNLPKEPGYDGGYPSYEGLGIDVNCLSPSTILTLFLGGAPDWFVYTDPTPTDLLNTIDRILPGRTNFKADKPIKGFLGLSADPTNPFGGPITHTARLKPMYEFDLNSVGWISVPANAQFNLIAGLAYWPKVQGVTDKSSGPIVYFRAENSNYTLTGIRPHDDEFVTGTLERSNVKNEALGVWAAMDTKFSNTARMDRYDSGKAITYKWVNDKSFQIFSSGLDQKYVAPKYGSVNGVGGTLTDVQMYPTGETYWASGQDGSAYDDIANFSNGTLESDIK
jgi:prepilin-type N-terminal cleavage/methylation domain-containing protein